MSKVDEILKNRDSIHGDYQKVAETSQRLKAVIADTVNQLPLDMNESLDLICTKIARIANGNYDEPDHWLDIAGYAQLIANRIHKK
jgi:hypothetical protein